MAETFEQTYMKYKTKACMSGYSCLGAGAAVPILGLERLFYRLSNQTLTPVVHMALAGMLAELWCHWQPNDWEYNKAILQDGERMLKSAAYGVFGGMIGSALQRQLDAEPLLGRVEV
jgi:hypothetical protein